MACGLHKVSPFPEEKLAAARAELAEIFGRRLGRAVSTSKDGNRRIYLRLLAGFLELCGDPDYEVLVLRKDRGNYISAVQHEDAVREQFRQEMEEGSMRVETIEAVRQEHGDRVRLDASGSQDGVFMLARDIRRGRRIPRVAREDHGLQVRALGSRAWIHEVGTFGIGSAAYHWARLAALIS